MPQCHNCHGAGFTMHQVAWSMGRVRILCKTCDGIGDTSRQVMTPLQRKQLANILLKEGEEGWRVENADLKGRHRDKWDLMRENHAVDTIGWKYRAVRIERVPTRTPLPIEHYRRGMEVQNDCDVAAIVVDRRMDGSIEIAWRGQSSSVVKKMEHFKAWRWPNETEWHPAFTETVEEKIVETLIVEGL